MVFYEISHASDQYSTWWEILLSLLFPETACARYHILCLGITYNFDTWNLEWSNTIFWRMIKLAFVSVSGRCIFIYSGHKSSLVSTKKQLCRLALHFCLQPIAPIVIPLTDTRNYSILLSAMCDILSIGPIAHLFFTFIDITVLWTLFIWKHAFHLHIC